jgi:hypothetical protein
MRNRPTRQQGGSREDAATGTEANVASVIPGADVPAQLRRRREAADRLPPRSCGHRDPLDCRESCRPGIAADRERMCAVVRARICADCGGWIPYENPYYHRGRFAILCVPCHDARGDES